MPFPISITGTVQLPAESVRSIAQLERYLRLLGTEITEATSQSLKFRVPVDRHGSTMDAIAIFDSGALTIERKSGGDVIQYRLLALRLPVITAAMAVGFPILVDDKLSIFSSVLIWLWLCGGNYVIAWLRFPLVLQRVVEGDWIT